ncbi:MAG: Na+/H+ antiporter subunit E [Bacillota bacterium]|nr:Na+/H+ antiporter subunit E [Bacillota bacterium]
MKRLKAIASTFILCFIFWLFYTGTFDIEEISAGLIVSILVALFSSAFFIQKEPFWLFKPERILALLKFIPIYAAELVKANWDVAKRALSRDIKINPGIVKISTELKSDYGLAMLAGCITLTPGTITMEVTEEDDKSYMYIHWIDVAARNMDEASNIIKGAFEPYVRRIFN